MINSKSNQLNKKLGFSLIDVIVGTALVSIVFLGVFGLFRLGIKVVRQSRTKITAAAIANEQIEMIRNLPYESVGVVGGFPEGLLESITSSTQNNITYTIEARVDYVVDSADGIASPQDECPNDYKKVEIKVSWPGQLGGEVAFVTDIVPENLAQECADEGGILSISVFDAYGIMVPSPLIEVKDPLTDQLIKSATPADGEHYFSLDSSSTYKVVVSKFGFSSERTYGTDEVAHPNKPHLWVFEDKLTEASFSIDETSTFSVDTFSPWGEDYFYDSFSDSSKVSNSNNVTIADGKVNLIKTSGVYFSGGITDDDLCSFPGNNGDCGQSFTMASQSKDVSQIQLYLRKATTTPSDIYMEIRSASTTGPLIASSIEVGGAGLPINFEWITFNLHNSVILNAGTQYFLRLRSIPDSVESQGQGPIHWGYLYSTSSPPGYQGGNAFRYIGVNQEDLSDYDFSFKIYEDEYVSSGDLTSITVAPLSLVNWNEFSWTDSETIDTDIKYQMYYASGTNWFLIPNSDLPGNEIGFDISPVELSGLDIATYSQLRLKANLSTTDPDYGPSLYDWQLSWITNIAIPIPNVSFLLTGAKTIGTDINEDPVYKYSATSTSDSNGHIDVSDLEWDSYTFYLSPASGLDLVDTDPSPQPINLLPDNTTQVVVLYLEANNSLLVNIQDNETLDPIFAADVRLYNGGLGYDVTQYTNEKGQTYFIPLEIATYNLEVTAPGYSATYTTVQISGDKTKTVRLEQIE